MYTVSFNDCFSRIKDINDMDELDGVFCPSWTVVFENICGEKTQEIEFSTNRAGEGLWQGEKQILGTCQFSLRNCSSRKSRVAYIRRFFKRHSEQDPYQN